MITVYYGIPNKKINITNKLIPLKNNKNIIVIPNGDTLRDTLFSDPVPKVNKYIIVQLKGVAKPYMYSEHFNVYIDLFMFTQILFTPKLIVRGYIPPANNIQYPGNVFPITFCIPEEKIVNTIPKKKKMLSSLIPWNNSTYLFNTEDTYYTEYKESMFGITCLKAGWDCMRHYELMANGCIPYFIDLHECPKNTMAFLPKKLFTEGNELFHRFGSKKIEALTISELDICTTHISKLVDYTRQHLTTCIMSNYILEKSNHTNVSKILYIGINKPDYLSMLILHGLKTRFGSKCHEYPKQPYLYKFNSNSDSNINNVSELYGKGITYSELLDINMRDDDLDQTLIHNIQNKYYDIIIYPNYHRSMLYYDLVNTVYSPNDIILLCKNGIRARNYHTWANKKHPIFIREMD